MCGIMGYVGNDPSGIGIVLEGLRNLLHRGYDSIGICFYDEISKAAEIHKKSTEKSKEVRVEYVEAMIPDINRACHVGFGHTRWASCGRVTDLNAHPHRSGKFVVVQNGNVENHRELKAELLADGYTFSSETDTEVIAHLFSKHYAGKLVSTTKCVLSRITGANALVVFCEDFPDRLIAVNRGGTLLIGKGEKGVIVTSDPLALPVWTEKRIDLENSEVAILRADEWEVHYDGSIIEKTEQACTSNGEEKAHGYETDMLKEINEQPEVLRNAMSGRLLREKGTSKLGGLSDVTETLRQASTFHFIGCGTAHNACQYAVLVLNRFGISARSWVASEFCYCHPVYDPSDVFIFISQSGETADSIAALEEIRRRGKNLTLGLINVVDSKIARRVDAGVYIRAGGEKGVASTKAYTGHLATIVMLALFLARQRKIMETDMGQQIIDELEAIPGKIEQILKQNGFFEELAKKYSGFRDWYYLGRYFNFITAKEGDLKFKEISCIHSEGYPLGEMKHGPIALIDSEFCSLVVIQNDSIYQKSLANIAEIKAREGRVVVVTNPSCVKDLEDSVDDIIIVPETLEYLSPILTVIPLQLFSYYMAKEREKNPDRPRNLAKTVTVE